MRLRQNIAAKLTVLLATVAAFTGTWALVRDVRQGDPGATPAIAAQTAPVQRSYEGDDDDDDDRDAFPAPAGNVQTLRVPDARTHAS